MLQQLKEELSALKPPSGLEQVHFPSPSPTPAPPHQTGDETAPHQPAPPRERKISKANLMGNPEELKWCVIAEEDESTPLLLKEEALFEYDHSVPMHVSDPMKKVKVTTVPLSQVDPTAVDTISSLDGTVKTVTLIYSSSEATISDCSFKSSDETNQSSHSDSSN